MDMQVGDKFHGLVPRVGLEPTSLAALAPKASASANFATSAIHLFYRFLGENQIIDFLINLCYLIGNLETVQDFEI